MKRNICLVHRSRSSSPVVCPSTSAESSMTSSVIGSPLLRSEFGPTGTFDEQFPPCGFVWADRCKLFRIWTVFQQRDKLIKSNCKFRSNKWRFVLTDDFLDIQTWVKKSEIEDVTRHFLNSTQFQTSNGYAHWKNFKYRSKWCNFSDHTENRPRREFSSMNVTISHIKPSSFERTTCEQQTVLLSLGTTWRRKLFVFVVMTFELRKKIHPVKTNMRIVEQ